MNQAEAQFRESGDIEALKFLLKDPTATPEADDNRAICVSSENGTLTL